MASVALVNQATVLSSLHFGQREDPTEFGTLVKLIEEAPESSLAGVTKIYSQPGRSESTEGRIPYVAHSRPPLGELRKRLVMILSYTSRRAARLAGRKLIKMPDTALGPLKDIPTEIGCQASCSHQQP